jgi:hypothetical protein
MTDDYRTIPSLMLKDTDYASLIHGENDVYSITDALQMCDALEEVVKVWSEGMQAFDLKTQEDSAGKVYGYIVFVRMLFNDLLHKIPEVSQKEAEETLAAFATSFLPLARSYSRTPMLAQWYLSIPMRVAGTYGRLRRGR